MNFCILWERVVSRKNYAMMIEHPFFTNWGKGGAQDEMALEQKS